MCCRKFAEVGVVSWDACHHINAVLLHNFGFWLAIHAVTSRVLHIKFVLRRIPLKHQQFIKCLTYVATSCLHAIYNKQTSRHMITFHWPHLQQKAQGLWGVIRFLNATLSTKPEMPRKRRKKMESECLETSLESLNLVSASIICRILLQVNTVKHY